MVKIRDLESVQSVAESSEEEVQVLGIRKMKRKGGKARPSKRVRFEDALPQGSSASGVKQMTSTLVQTDVKGWAEDFSESEEDWE